MDYVSSGVGIDYVSLLSILILVIYLPGKISARRLPVWILLAVRSTGCVTKCKMVHSVEHVSAS